MSWVFSFSLPFLNETNNYFKKKKSKQNDFVESKKKNDFVKVCEKDKIELQGENLEN